MHPRPRCTAIHEAGHALAFWWNGQPIARVSVRTLAQTRAGPLLDLRGNWQYVAGLVEADYRVPRPAFEAPGIAEYLPSMVEAIERDLLHCFAGPVAEAIYRHAGSARVISGSGRGDLSRGHELISLLPPRKLLDAQALAIARASRLVHRYWSAVVDLADLLQERGMVDGETVNARLCAISGESPTPLGNDLASLDPWRQRGTRASSTPPDVAHNPTAPGKLCYALTCSAP
ncbi:hypothetical protein [Pseudomonas chlororaphis]|uniref:hypothetical protein n=1 Tax=Pseudomonas chlororaphis TaxID=587753 RepID=UPI000A75BA07|nr:hypothetical protein [Pseudomonas chlororaphis]